MINPKAINIFKKVYKGGSNMITPERLEIDFIPNQKIVYELSKGNFMRQILYGLTLVKYNSQTGEANRMDESRCSVNLEYLRNVIKALSEGKPVEDE